MMEIETSMDENRTIFAARTRDENVKLSEIHVKPLNSPHFSGNIRQYVSFKQDFNRLMTNQYGQDPYALRQCLSGEALETIKGIEGDYLEMFQRLDAKYGEPRKLVDAIIFDIQKLKPVPEGDSRKFINMVDVVNWNQDAFILLPAGHRFTKLFIQHVHGCDHAGVEVTLAKVQRKFWVPRARKIIKQIKSFDIKPIYFIVHIKTSTVTISHTHYKH